MSVTDNRFLFSRACGPLPPRCRPASPRSALGRTVREQRPHLPGEVVKTITKEVWRRGREGQVAGQDALAISQEVGDAWYEELLRNTKASSAQHILEAVSSFRGGALAGAPDRSKILLHQRLDLAVGDRRSPRVWWPGPPRSRAVMTCWPRSSTTRLFAPPMACLTRPPARLPRSARSAGDWTCAAAPARACGSSDPCARDRSRASTSARACSRRRAVRTPAPGGYGPTSGPCPSPGPSTWRSASGRSGTSSPPNGPRCSPAWPRAAARRDVRLPGRRAAARHLRRVLGIARVRPGHAGPQCRVASPVRHVLPHLPAARGPQRPDRHRIHRDDPPPDGAGPARGRQPAVPACPRAQSQHAPADAHAADCT